MLSLGDVTTAVAPIGLFLGRIANFINGELWGRPTDVPWAMIFPTGGPIPRHPSQLYEAALEGVVLFVVLNVLVRLGALKRPGVVTGSFALGYGIARITCEFFREPDPQLGFLWGGLTMGMLLCIPLMLAGIAILAYARQAANPSRKMADEHSPLEQRNPPAHRHRRADAGRRIHAAVPDPSAATAITSTATRSAPAAISSPRPRSARCSAN